MAAGGRTAVVGGLAALLLIAAFAIWLVPKPAAVPRLDAISFHDLKGWAADDHQAALAAFLKSCARSGTPPSISDSGRLAAWAAACQDAALVAANDDAAARRFFETAFTAMELTLGGQSKGLLTGYYEPEILGSLTQKPGFETPLYRSPGDLVSADLGLFSADLAGRRITGRVQNGRFIPYFNRAEIADGALRQRDLELLWVNDPIDAFVLEIQGSGRVRLEDGTLLRVGYAGKNGHPYTAIGRTLVAEGALAADGVTMPAIRDWLAAHPDQQQRIFNSNASTVFFLLLDGDGPVGSEGVALTPGRSLAVDVRHIALGLPVWIESSVPAELGGGVINRLTVAQDTGGAITGALRGDLFWGPGEAAAAMAGRMQEQARFVVLIPKPVSEIGS